MLLKTGIGGTDILSSLYMFPNSCFRFSNNVGLFRTLNDMIETARPVRRMDIYQGCFTNGRHIIRSQAWVSSCIFTFRSISLDSCTPYVLNTSDNKPVCILDVTLLALMIQDVVYIDSMFSNFSKKIIHRVVKVSTCSQQETNSSIYLGQI